MIKYDPVGGEHIDSALEKAIRMAAIADEPVSLTFNQTTIRVEPTHLRQLYRLYESAGKSSDSASGSPK